MSWEQPVMDAFEGFGQFMSQVSPSLFTIALVLFVGSLLVYIGKRVVFTVS